MSQFTFGQRVLVRDYEGQSWHPAVFIRPSISDNKHCVLFENGTIIVKRHCKLDLDASEFVNGDKVEVSDNGKVWFKATYIGKDEYTYFTHVVRTDVVDFYKYCRYPQQSDTKTQIAKLKDKINKLEQKINEE